MAKLPDMNTPLFKKGRAVRTAVVGAEYVDRALSTMNEFNAPMQKLVTEWCWGDVWGRPGISRKTRSMLNLAMLTALGKTPEIKLHVKGALNNGISVDEIKAVLLHATAYCGIPAGLDAFKAAHEVLLAEGALPVKAAKPEKEAAPAKAKPAKKKTAK
jgi:4-carboxymuconolactone decarboxylase